MASILVNIARICDSQFKCNYLKNQRHLINFLLHFWNLHEISNFLIKNMIDIANIFLKLETVKNFIRPLCKKRSFRTPFDSQHVKVSQIIAKPPSERFYHVFSSFWEKLIWKISPVLLGEILRTFLNRLIARASILLKIDRICDSQFKCNYLRSKKIFLDFFFHFWNLP